MAADQPSGRASVTAGRSLLALGAQALRRRWRCLRRRLGRPPVSLVYHQAYGESVASVPLDRQRAERILAFLAEEGLAGPDEVVLPRPPSVRNLLRVHAAGYLESLQHPEMSERVFGAPLSDEAFQRVVEMQRLMVGGTIQATRLALRNSGVACNLGGGLHHAERELGKGFCLFNDVAVAIARLRARGFKAPILVVDLDLHDGDGTRAIFRRDPSVHTYSVHAENWGDTEAVASTTIALGEGVTDEVYLGTLLKTLPDVVASVAPGLVVYLAGVDPAASDPLGNWKITAKGMLIRDRLVLELVRTKRGTTPLVVLLAGGYGDRAWSYSGRFLSYLLAHRTIEPPANEELTLLRFRRLRRQLEESALTAEPEGFSWSLTDEDLVGILPGPRRATRFLGYFSRHGVELVLERFGILDQLRVRGFRHPTIDFDLDHPLGETLRVYGDVDRAELLIELRVRRDQRAVPGFELLAVEWLLLQNPRAEFGPYRRPLPGQKHPGLGLLREVLGWLVVVAEMLELDGIYYAPSSYHVAAQSRRMVRFLEPEHEARFRAFEQALAGRPLGVASRAVADGKLHDRASGESVAWEGFPMVLPVSERLRERVFGEGYEERVAAAAAAAVLDLELVGEMAPA